MKTTDKSADKRGKKSFKQFHKELGNKIETKPDIGSEMGSDLPEDDKAPMVSSEAKDKPEEPLWKQKPYRMNRVVVRLKTIEKDIGNARVAMKDAMKTSK